MQNYINNELIEKLFSHDNGSTRYDTKDKEVRILLERYSSIRYSSTLIPILITVNNVITTDDYNMIAQEIKQKSARDMTGEVFCSKEQGKLLYLVTKTNTLSKQVLMVFISNLTASLKTRFFQHFRASVDIIVGKRYSTTYEFISDAPNLSDLLIYCQLSKNRVCYMDEILSAKTSLPSRYLERVCAHIMDLVQSHDTKTAKSEVTALFDLLIQKYDISAYLWTKNNLASSLVLYIQKITVKHSKLDCLYPQLDNKHVDCVKASILSLLSYIDSINGSDQQLTFSSLEKIKLYIHDNYNNPISLADVSEHVGLSREHICRIFSRYLECTFVEYLNGYRIDKAKELLIHSDYNVNQISERVGFSNSKYFCTVFKKYTTTSPKQFQLDIKLYKKKAPQ